jgi:hypothetical protein
MPRNGTMRAADSATDLRVRALIIRGHADDFWREPTVHLWLELADDLEAQAAALEAEAGMQSPPLPST